MKEGKDNIQSYIDNEASANRHMSFALLFTAALLLFVWFFYFFKVFRLAEDTYYMTISVIPFVFALLLSPMIFIRSNLLRRSGYKYYLLYLFVFAITVLNVIMPKHGVLGWAVCIVLTAHYYDPKACRIIFISVLLLMILAVTGGVFIGEFDSNLLTGELDKQTQVIHNYLLPEVYEDSAAGRAAYLDALAAIGYSRYPIIYGEYCLGRVLFITLVFVVTYALNIRTKNLLRREVNASTINQKISTELDVAKDIQLNTLPEEFVSSEDLEIIGELKAAREVGGDLYDRLEIDADHVAVLIGDVSGKGVPAAMFMMKTITSFRDFARSGKKPSEILSEINASMVSNNRTSMFVTAFLAILDKRNGKVVFANAGHNPPLVGHNKAYHYLDCKHGLLLGCFDELPLVDEEFVLEPGDSFTLYTDGITEARNAFGEFFGEQRLLDAMNRKEYNCTIELHHGIKDELFSFVGEAPQSDDITLLSLRYRGGNHYYEEREFPALRENTFDMLSFISDFGKEHNFPDDFRNKLMVVGDELVSNIINHGYAGEMGSIAIRLLFDESKNEFALTLIDKAKAFNQLTVESSGPVSGDVDKLKIGGLGLLIVKKIMDECAYDRLNGKNILVLKKRF